MRSRAYIVIALALAAAGCPMMRPLDESCGQDPYADLAPPSLRDPVSGECGEWGLVFPEDPSSGCSGPGASPTAPPDRDWASCPSACDGLDETSCLVADGCRAVYVAGDSESLTFVACWATAPSGPVRGGDCAAITGAQECSRHDDCSVLHGGDAEGIGEFRACRPETPVLCDGNGVAPAYLLRDPESGRCGFGGSDPCAGDFTPVMPDWGSCPSACDELDRATCLLADGCRPIYAEACPPWADCSSLEYVACWPSAPSGPERGGDCTALSSAYECSRHDDCGAVHERDWSTCPDEDSLGLCAPPLTGFVACRAESDGGPAEPGCGLVDEEQACIEAALCQPVYQGSGCGCTDAGCTCETWSFVLCEDA